MLPPEVYHFRYLPAVRRETRQLFFFTRLDRTGHAREWEHSQVSKFKPVTYVYLIIFVVVGLFFSTGNIKLANA